VTINFLISQKDCLKRWVDNQNNHYKYNIYILDKSIMIIIKIYTNKKAELCL
jgi:hypothetical protein